MYNVRTLSIFLFLQKPRKVEKLFGGIRTPYPWVVKQRILSQSVYSCIMYTYKPYILFMKTHVLTTTISHDMALWLDQTSLRYKRTKRDILETALRRFRKKTRKIASRLIHPGGRRWDILDMTEAGADDLDTVK